MNCQGGRYLRARDAVVFVTRERCARKVRARISVTYLYKRPSQTGVYARVRPCTPSAEYALNANARLFGWFVPSHLSNNLSLLLIDHGAAGSNNARVSTRSPQSAPSALSAFRVARSSPPTPTALRQEALYPTVESRASHIIINTPLATLPGRMGPRSLRRCVLSTLLSWLQTHPPSPNQRRPSCSI
jgi:hypothetical protein